MVLDGPINGLWLPADVDQALVPSLSRGDIVIITIWVATRARASAKRSRPQA